MGIEVNRLDGGKVAREKRPGMYADGAGLYLQITAATSKSWIFRYKRKGDTRWMGLGSAKTFGLAEARERARRQRQLLADGLDPIQEREKTRLAVELEAARSVTFEKCATDYIKDHSPGWRSPKHAAQWIATLKTYAYPVIGSYPVQEIDTPLVVKVLRPIWAAKPETAGRVRGRIEAVLQWATKAKLRTGDNPAQLSALPLPPLIRKVRHMPSLPYAELPAFILELRRQEGTAAKVLELAILCASRSAEAIGFRWDEFDGIEKVWTIPAERMKSGRPHRVPLSDRALEIIEGMRGQDRLYVFPGSRPGRPLNTMALLMLLRRMDCGHVTVHGFRSSFRDWCRERSNFSREVAEEALAHVVGDKTERAYARGDVLLKRRQLMAAWSRYCESGKSLQGEVVPMQREHASA